MLTVEGYAYIGEVAQSNSSDAANVACKFELGIVRRSHALVSGIMLIMSSLSWNR